MILLIIINQRLCLYIPPLNYKNKIHNNHKNINLKIHTQMNKSRVKINDNNNIQFHIYIGEYKIVLNTPKQTRVSDVINMVASYQNIHLNYGPSNTYFIGLASYDGYEIVDYWMTQTSFNFVKFGNKLALKALYGMEKRVDQLTTNQLEFIKCLGQGACGSVYLVRSRITGYLFALKRIKKESFQHFQDMLSLSRQQKILKNLPPNNHTVKFHACYQSVNHFNFLLQFYPGGQLFVHLSRHRLSENECKIYFCEVLAAIQFLHKNNILYRDLKPENIFVDIHGHLFIGDFGLSKCNFYEEDNANSHCGSTDYMAPQIIQNKQYNFCSDFYSIGAILHEFLTGLPPYYSNADEEGQQKLYKIKKMNLKLDQFTDNHHLKVLIKGLLHPNPDLRITSFQQIKKSPWLADIDWKKIQQKTSIGPFAPNVYNTYINEQFLNKQPQVDQMNKYFECQKFQSSNFVDYIRPESQKLLLGRARTQLHREAPHQLMKKKTNNLIKQKSTKNLNNKSVTTQSHHTINKGNISIALYQKHTHRQQRGDTATTSNSNVSCYEAKTTKHAQSKQNCNFKKQGSKKNLLKKVPSCTKMQPNPSSSIPNSHNVSQFSNRKLGVSKQKSGGLTLKTRNTQMLKSRGNLTPVNKSKSKQKSTQMLGFNKMKQQPYLSTKTKKQILPVSSYKIKLM